MASNPNSPGADQVRAPEAVEHRREILRRILLSNADTGLSFLAVFKLLKELLPKDQANYKPHTFRDDLLALTFENHDLTVPGVRGPNDNPLVSGPVQLTTRNEKFQSILVRRKKQAAEIKRRLGCALWYWLLGLDLMANEPPRWSSWHGPNEIRHRMLALRTKANLALFIDSGSSTDAALEMLLRVERIPFITRSEEGSSSGEDITSLVRPTVITNAPSIADLVSRSRHGTDLSIRFVGGDLRPDRGSICGALAEMCVTNWNLRSDVAVIGTTSVRPMNGISSFGCDDILEARAKGSFLQNATFRIVIFDSSKLIGAPATNVFASALSGQVDVIVTNEPAKDDPAHGSFVTFFDQIKDKVGLIRVQREPNGSGQPKP